MTLVVRLVAAVVAALLSVPSASAISLATPVAVSHGYSGHYVSLALGYSTTERGPPETYNGGTNYDRWSRGTSTRSNRPTPSPIYTYDHPAMLVPAASVATTTGGYAVRYDGVPSSPEPSKVAAKAGSGADNVVNGVRLRAQLTGREIAGGHAFEKHIFHQGEFPGIRTRAQFASYIEDIVMNGEMRPLGGGRSAYWREGTVVIRNPRAPDGGTAFQPKDGYDYFLNQLH